MAALCILPSLRGLFSPYEDLDPTVGRPEIAEIKCQHSYLYISHSITCLLPFPFFCRQAGAVPDSVSALSIWSWLHSASWKNLFWKNSLLATEGPLSEKDFASLQSFPLKRQRTSSSEITGKHDCRIKVATTSHPSLLLQLPEGYFWQGLAGLTSK